MTERRYATDPYAHVREAFRLAALGLMEWRDPAELTRAEYARLEGLPNVRAHTREDDATKPS